MAIEFNIDIRIEDFFLYPFVDNFFRKIEKIIVIPPNISLFIVNEVLLFVDKNWSKVTSGMRMVAASTCLQGLRRKRFLEVADAKPSRYSVAKRRIWV